jgi:streptogramin lyase
VGTGILASPTGAPSPGRTRGIPRRALLATAAIAATCAAALTPSAALAAPVGQIKEFPTGYDKGQSHDPMAAGPDGAVWFTDRAGNRIGRITPDGTVRYFRRGLTPKAGPAGIAAGPDGNMWFAEANANQIGKITPDGTITEYSAGISSDAQPVKIAAGPDGNMWFTEVEGNRIGKITLDGKVTEYDLPRNPEDYPTDPDTPEEAKGPKPAGIAAGPDGNIWFTEIGGDRIGRITPDGDITEYPLGENLKVPANIAAGPDGALWFTKLGSGRIGRITTDGDIDKFAIPGNSYEDPVNPADPGDPADPDNPADPENPEDPGDPDDPGNPEEPEEPKPVLQLPSGIAAGPDGHMWFTILNVPKIGRISADGTVTLYSRGLSADAYPNGITAGPDGNMWFNETVSSRIGRIGTGAPAASVQAPTVVGSGHADTEHECATGTWSDWAIGGPGGFAIQWLLDGRPIAGATGTTYTPAATDIGHRLSCRVTASYPRPILPVDVTATSQRGLRIAPKPAEPQAPTPPAVPADPNPAGPAGPSEPPAGSPAPQDTALPAPSSPQPSVRPTPVAPAEQGSAQRAPAVAPKSRSLQLRAGRSSVLTVTSINARTITVVARRNGRGRAITLARTSIPRQQVGRRVQRKLRFRAPRATGRYTLTITAIGPDGRRTTTRGTLTVRR